LGSNLLEPIFESLQLVIAQSFTMQQCYNKNHC
jgi:hypothetical protein